MLGEWPDEDGAKLSRYYVYCRNWGGFTDEFPFYDEVNGLRDDLLAQRLDAKALVWLRRNKAGVKAHYRGTKKRRREAFEAVRRGLPAPTGQPAYASAVHSSTIKSFRATCLEAVRGPRRYLDAALAWRSSPLIQRVGRFAGWYNGIVGVPSPSSVLYLDPPLCNVKRARKVAASMAMYVFNPDRQGYEIRLRFGIREEDELDEVHCARIKLENKKLADEWSDFDLWSVPVVTYYRELVAELKPVESRPERAGGQGGEGTVRIDGEWSAPMTRTEIARRITGRANARPRKVQALLNRYGLQHVAGRMYQVRLDKMESNIRKIVEKPV